MPAVLEPAAKTQVPSPPQAATFDTSFGWLGLAYRGGTLLQITFGHSSEAKVQRALADLELNERGTSPDWIADLQSRLERLGEGEPQVFADVRIETDHLTPFACKVVAACRKIPWGRVLSYAELAAKAGRPDAARAIGNVMASNRFPLVVPCHRVIGSAGSLGGYSAPGGLETKRRLLKLEGALD